MTPLDYDKYKSLLVDSTGRRLTSGLFEELADPASAIKPLFKLADWRKTYVAISDPTDYKAALVLIGDWEHWQWLLTQCKAFNAEVVKWREEVGVKLQSEAVEQMKKHSKDPKGAASARWLAEQGWKEKKIGRPRKATEAEGDDFPGQTNRDYKRLIGGM